MRGQLETPDYISDPLLKEIYDRGELAAIPEYLRTTYINFIMSRNDELNSRAEMLEEALYKGREEGREIGLQIGREMGVEIGIEEGKKMGREEGIQKARKETAMKLKEMGMNDNDIAIATGLDIELISSL